MPPDLTDERRRLPVEMAERNEIRFGDELLGLVLSGSVGRGVATARSDLDVYVVVADRAGGDLRTLRSPWVDEMVVTLLELEQVPPYGSGGWWFRWSFEWAPVLLDRSGGRLAPALQGQGQGQGQATVTCAEADSILVGHGRMDG